MGVLMSARELFVSISADPAWKHAGGREKGSVKFSSMSARRFARIRTVAMKNYDHIYRGELIIVFCSSLIK